ncbi:MAG TPA: glycosyltransferase [Pyrinomonadaceae bacterium]|jgi:glycosyltransferase involved in cell wall biosynthesis
MSRETSIDIVICTYNNAALLDRSLATISKQRVPPGVNWQVLVVNNNCTDETPEVVEKHSRLSATSIRMVSEPTQGLTQARVCGVRNTSGEWIAFVDDDCLLADDWVAEAARFASEHPACGAFGGRVILDWEIAPPSYASHRRYAYAGKNHGETAHRRPWLAGAGMVLRRRALEESGWLDKQFLEDRTGKRLVSGGDMEIGLRVAARYEVWYNPACELRHVIPARRMSREYLRRITFGLGASRHNASALTWRGSYPGWLFYSSLYSLMFGAHGAWQLVREALSERATVDVALAFSPVRGWWTAMWGMLRMDAAERRQLLGCAVAARKQNP